MTPIVWVLLFLLLAVAMVLVCINIKPEKCRSAPPPVSHDDVAPKASEPTSIILDEQKYVSIYEYTTFKTAKKCAYCDGENLCDAEVCCICGIHFDD